MKKFFIFETFPVFVTAFSIVALCVSCGIGSDLDDQSSSGKKKAEEKALLEKGEEEFGTSCKRCHRIDEGKAKGPGLKGLAGSRFELKDGSTITADSAFIRKAITDPQGQIRKDWEGKVKMPKFSNFEKETLDALVAYIESLK